MTIKKITKAWGRKVKKILTVISSICFLSSAALAAVEVVNPMEFAEGVSRDYTYGDVYNEDGWRGCVFVAPQGGGDVAISCYGTVISLLYGNKPLTEDFECTFEFQKLEKSGTYLVLKRICE
jgi:hypothetical protein